VKTCRQTPRVDADLHKLLSRPGDGLAVSIYQSDQTIFLQGQVADSIFYVQSGCVRVAASRQGKECILGVRQAGQFLGETPLTGVAFRVTSARAVEQTRLTSIPIAAMDQAVHSIPGLAAGFTAHLLNRNSRIEADSIDKMLNSNESRLARLLLTLANFHSESELATTPISYNQKALAQMIGANRSRVSAFLNTFRRLGFITYRNGTINVHRSLWTQFLETAAS
jgi:CRP/FNR family transcriptional regulator, cyclic AMP receptor protein